MLPSIFQIQDRILGDCSPPTDEHVERVQKFVEELPHGGDRLDDRLHIQTIMSLAYAAQGYMRAYTIMIVYRMLTSGVLTPELVENEIIHFEKDVSEGKSIPLMVLLKDGATPEKGYLAIKEAIGDVSKEYWIGKFEKL